METEEKKKKSRVFKEEKNERKRKREKTKWHELWAIKVSLERREYKTIRLFMIEYKQEIQEK